MKNIKQLTEREQKLCTFLKTADMEGQYKDSYMESIRRAVSRLEDLKLSNPWDIKYLEELEMGIRACLSPVKAKKTLFDFFKKDNG